MTGVEAIKELRAAIEKGAVRGNILIDAAAIASQRAQPSLSAASRASQAEQQRYQNQVSNAAILASQNGVEQGFARLFRSLSVSLKESSGLIESFAQGFNKASEYVSSILLSVQSIQRFFQGRDSLLGDKFFPDEESQQKAFLFLQNFKQLASEIGTLVDHIYDGWKGIIDLFDSSGILDKLNKDLGFLNNTGSTVNSLISGNLSSASDTALSAASTLANTATTPIRTIVNGGLSAFTDFRIPAFKNYRSDLDFATQYKADQAKMAAEARNQYTLPGINRALGQGETSTNLEIKMDVSIQAANPEDFNQQFQEKFKGVLVETLSQYSQKE